MTQNEIEVKKLVEKWAQSVREKNLDQILASHVDDIVMFDVPPPFQSVGINAYRETWGLFFDNTKPGVFNFHELHVVADENVAFCYATMRCEDRSTTRDYVPLDFRLTIGLKKINGEWMIVHEHHSIPSD